MRKRFWPVGRMLAGMILLPVAAGACPRCYAAASSDVRHAYFLSLLLLSFLPLICITLLLVWILRQRRRMLPRLPREVRQ
ncbi:MAG: hypothetical protein ONB48_16295 [candidate division KSB1 bacterium]|nr:hypothetical protein [candidate division KSB1 bacterium]MDZ7274268.1 hypothetical protein [candidate division KSB1 bacterium]MDZ7287210.1 hypothetical protein [candidate division KSB1 bacterium]MDZ7296865.1 hypothetical protein [candidate division KSB1 bacterium]MDZ7306030.1 hypothetical protein [candidate division KSB1 bacterium]